MSLLRGAVAGAAATVPMTAAMVWMHGRLPPEEQYPLPPREIVDELVDATPAGRHKAAIASHFAYGAAGGAMFFALHHHASGPAVVKGIVFGLAVWSGSYLGWLPAAGILKPATEHPARRNALMIAAHVIWGASLGLLAGRYGRMPLPSYVQSASFTHGRTDSSARPGTGR